MKQQYLIWRDGYEAYHEGETVLDNPYDVGTEQFDAWMNGFEYAKNEEAQNDFLFKPLGT